MRDMKFLKVSAVNLPTSQTYLLVGGDGAKDDFGESLRWKHSKANSADDFGVLDQGEAFVLRVEHEAGDVFLRHTRQLE